MRRERIPLLHDHHNHPSVYGAMRTCVDLSSVADKAAALRLIEEREEEIVFVLGWNDALFEIESADLTALPPAFVVNTSLHGFRLNDGARRRLAATHPEIVERIDDQAWVERNLPAVLKLIVDVKGCDAVCLRAFYDLLLEQGVWSAQDMLVPGRSSIEAVETAGLTARTLLWADPETFGKLDGAARARVHGIKLFTDGALGARTAAMTEPLLSGEAGILLRTDAELRSTLEEVSGFDKPLAVHAVGDRALEQILGGLEDLDTGGVRFPQVRLEHCQFTTTSSARRIKALGAVLSMQPNFSIETIDYSDRLSPAYCALNNPFRRLIDDDGFVPGEDLILGSDGMPHGAQFALEMALFPPLDSQRLTLEEFVAGYCMPDETTGTIDVLVDHDHQAIEIETIWESV